MKIMLFVFAFALQANAVTYMLNNIAVQPAPFLNPQFPQTCRESSGKKFGAYVELSRDKKLSVKRTDRDEPMLSELELGRLNLSFQGVVTYACDELGLAFLAYDPTRPQQTGNGVIPASVLMIKTWDGQVVTRATQNTSFTAPDPRGLDSKPVAFSFFQGYYLKMRGDNIYLLSLALPPPLPGVPNSPEVVLLQFRGLTGDPQPIWFNEIDRTTYQLKTIPQFCQSGSSFFMSGAGPAMNTGQGVYRLEQGRLKLVSKELQLNQNGPVCTDSGVIYSGSNGTVFEYVYVSDAGKETVLYSGAQVSGLRFAVTDRLYAVDDKTLFTTAGGGLVRIIGSIPIVYVFPGQLFGGGAVGVFSAGERLLYVQAEQGGNQAYWLYEPSLFSPEIFVHAGKIAYIPGVDLFIDNNPPVLDATIDGRQVVSGTTLDRKLQFMVPDTVAPGTYSGNVLAAGAIPLPVNIIVLPADEPIPVIQQVVRQASGLSGPVAPRMYVSLIVDGLPACVEQLGADLAYSFCGTSVDLDSLPARIISSNGKRIIVSIPSAATIKANAALTVKYNGIASAQVALQIVPRADELAVYEIAGMAFPVVMDDFGKTLYGPFNPVVSGTTVVAYGTGCGNGGLMDDANTPSPGVKVDVPAVAVNGQPVEVIYAGLVAGYSGLCQVNFKVPAGLAPGPASLTLGDKGLTYILPIK